MSKSFSKNDLNEYISISYRNNRNSANQNKLKWIRIGDPILQRGEQYIPKEKPIQQCSKNYFQRMKEKEAQLQKKLNSNNNNSFNLYTQSFSTYDTERKGKKKIDLNQYKSNKKNELKSHIRIFPSKYNTKSMNEVLDRTYNNNNKEQNKKRKYYYKPSEEYIKMNNREKLLPSENKERSKSLNYFNNNIRYNRDSYKETSQRVFGYNFKPNNNLFSNYYYNIPSNNENKRSQSTPRMRYVNKIELKNKEDHINDLINSFQKNIKENFIPENKIK